MAAPDPRCPVLAGLRGLTFVASVASLALGTAGCVLLEVFAEPPPPWVAVRGERSVAPPTAPITRILLLPLQTGDAIDAHAESLRAALAQVLRDACGFDVVAPVASALPRTTRDAVMTAAASGGGADAARDVPALIRLHREWEADAVLFGKLAFSRPHTEPAVGVELALIDARDGARLWSAQDVVDARDPSVRASLLRFRADEAGGDPTDPAQVPFDSFTRFVARSFVRTLFAPPEGMPGAQEGVATASAQEAPGNGFPTAPDR